MPKTVVIKSDVTILNGFHRFSSALKSSILTCRWLYPHLLGESPFNHHSITIQSPFTRGRQGTIAPLEMSFPKHGYEGCPTWGNPSHLENPYLEMILLYCLIYSHSL